MLDIAPKIPLIYRISCVGDITEFSPFSWSKHIEGIFPAEVPRKFRGWHVRREVY